MIIDGWLRPLTSNPNFFEHKDKRNNRDFSFFCLHLHKKQIDYALTQEYNVLTRKMQPLKKYQPVSHKRLAG